MKTLATIAALFFWLQVVLCGLDGLDASAVLPPDLSEAVASGPLPESSRESHHHAVASAHHPAPAGQTPTSHHHGEGPGPGLADHCELVGQALSSASHVVLPPVAPPILPDVPSLGTSRIALAVAARTALRFPPRPRDPIIENLTLLI